MAISEKHVDEIVALYDGGNGDSVGDLAAAFPGFTKAAILYHLKKRGVYVEAKRGKSVSGSINEQTDEDLGIGADEGVQSGADDIGALLADPRVAAAINSIVDQRLKAASPQAQPVQDFGAFLAQFQHLIDAQVEQKPGYMAPLSAAEKDARLKGQKDMVALLATFKAQNVWPHYLLADEANPYYGPSPNGLVLYQPGQEILMRGPPSEGFKPINEAAIQVFEAYKRWVGEPVDMDELTAEAARIAHGDNSNDAPQTYMETKIEDSDARLVETPIRDISPKRVLGTSAPELRGKTMPRQPGVMAQPAGPVYVSDVA